MAWKKRLQYICGKCWQNISEFHNFQESVIEAQRGLHLKEVRNVNFKPEENINQHEIQLELHNAQKFSVSTEDLMKPTALTFDIKTEEPLDLYSDYDGMSSQGLEQLTDEEISRLSFMSSREENTFLQNDDESNEDCSSNDDLPLSSLSQTKPSSSVQKILASKKSVEEFDTLVALWRSSLKCEICHRLVASYSQLKEHFSKNHAPEGCYLMCCQLRLETRYDIDRHIRYHNAPQHLKCEACCKAFRIRAYLKHHQRKVHTSKGKDENAKDTKKLEGKYRCCNCSKTFGTHKQLAQHNRYVHKPKNFECKFCEKPFVRRDALLEHMASHTGEKTHACSFCSKSFTWRSSFCQHMKKYHPHECSKVQRETRHLASNTGEKAHACSFCPKAFTCRANFRQHMRACHPQEWNEIQGRSQGGTHKGHRREIRGENIVYVCTYCSKEYEKLNAIYKHVRRCQGDDRPIQAKKGYRRETWGEHKVYVCIFCSKEYEKWTHMHYHLYKYHRNEEALAKQPPKISKPPTPAEREQPIHSRRTRISQVSGIIAPTKTTDVTNKTPDREDKEGDTKMASIEGKQLEEANAAKINVKTERFSADTNALENEEINENDMSPVLKDATWESQEFIKSEKAFI
ncbi:zinc finger protein 808 [Stomoxys calcitrans]|uniref:zinc finger protein 808 n=1 Tax=Stomoxys calcitrans TaxID=35570 RepID=UPI0027E23009|nr:zinc finger protein 808 [Stomoxys calcitrans]